MGYHCDTLYIGPAIKLSKAKMLVPETINACSDDTCENSRVRMTSNFCSDCGSPVVPRIIKKSRVVGLNDFVYAEGGKYKHWGDWLLNPPHDADGILIPNHSRKGLEAFSGDIDERTITVGPQFPENMAKQKAVFEEYYGEMMADMREFGMQFEVIYVIKTYGL